MTDRPLTICAIGNADSVHVATRTRCFAELGHNVFLISPLPSEDGIRGVTELVPEVPERLVAFVGGFSRVLGAVLKNACRVVAFLGILRRSNPDVIHVHYAYNYYGWLAGLLGARPLVVTVMGGDILFDEQGAPTRVGKWLTAELLREADYITAKSEHLVGVLERLGAGAKAERVVWGISLASFRRTDPSALRAQLGLRAEHRVVLSPKILQPFYRVERIVEAMPAIVQAVPSAVLLVTEYGADPAYKVAIKTLVRDLRLEENVVFCGRVRYDDMPAYYSLAELTVSVPSSDGLPQTLLEGMACETPSVLARLPRYEELVSHRRSAYFVDAEPPSIAHGVVELLGDASLRSEIARNALEIVRRQGSLEEQAKHVERRMRQLAREPSRVWSARRLMRAVAAFIRFAMEKRDVS